MSNFKEIGFQVGLLFVKYKRSFVRLKISFSNETLETNNSNPKRRGANGETKLLEVRHLSKPKLLYIGLPNFDLKPAVSNVCGLHMRERSEELGRKVG